VNPRNHLLDIAERFKPNTVLWAFHTIQPSSIFYIFTVNFFVKASCSIVLAAVRLSLALNFCRAEMTVSQRAVGHESSGSTILDGPKTHNYFSGEKKRSAVISVKNYVWLFAKQLRSYLS